MPCTFFSTWNFFIVATRSCPIRLPVCCLTGELKSRRYFLSSHCISLFAGELINEMLNDVQGQCLQVDQPSHMIDTFEGMCFQVMCQQGKVITQFICTSTMLQVRSLSLATFAFTDMAIHDFLGMSLLFILGFRQVLKPHIAGCSTNQNG